ncbi:CYIR protein, partial [Plasmodium cynomolgi strain B]
YFDFNNYIKVKNKLNKCNYDYKNEDRFSKIISRLTEHKSVNWEDKIFACLHHYLTYNNGFMPFGVGDYCRYINFWLNGDVISKYQKYQHDFNIFKDFVHNYVFVHQGNYDDSCYEYINKMEIADYNRMKYLYEFYEFYDELRSSSHWKEETCEKLSSNSFFYNRDIDEYYEKHSDLYDKISHVKDLIETLLKTRDIKCENSVYFGTPRKVLEYERQRKQQEEAERQRQEQIQKELGFNNRGKKMHTTTDAKREELHQGKLRLSLEQENSRETVNLGVQDPSKVLTYGRGSDNSGGVVHSNKPALRKSDEDELEIRVHKPKNEDTSTDGSFLGSSRLPGVITELLVYLEGWVPYSYFLGYSKF